MRSVNRKTRRGQAFLAVLMSVCLLLSTGVFSLCAAVLTAEAAAQTGIVRVDDALRVREGAGTSYASIDTLKNGTSLTILETATDSSGGKWYKVTYSNGSKSGWVSADYVELITSSSSTAPSVPVVSDPMSDEEFEEYMTEQGFPESYKDGLRTLHQEHPNWVYVAQHLDMDWSVALEAECVVGRNLIARSTHDSWKSFEQGAYNWNNDSWYGLDGSSWVAASAGIIAYYMDPRNFLSDPYIFMFESLEYSDLHNIDGVRNILSGTFMDGDYTTPDTDETFSYAETLMEAASRSGVSVYHLASRIRQEQGKNGNGLGKGTVAGYENYFNFFNFRAYATASGSALTNGAKFAATTNEVYLLPWTNQYKSLVGGSIYLGLGYIDKGQNTLYLQKFDVVDGGNGYYSHQYMTNVQAVASEAATIAKAYSEEILNSTMVFYIPVYKHMPETAAVKPTTEGNNNNLLESITVDEFSLTPSFTRYTTDYELVVENEVAEIHIKTKTSDSGAKVAGDGTVQLMEGCNTIELAVTASSGVMRVYTLTVYRKAPDGTVPPTGTTITPITPTTTTTTTTSPDASGSDPSGSTTSTTTTTTTTTATTTTAPDPTIGGNGFTMGEDNLLTGVSEQLSASELISALGVQNGSVKVTAADGKEKSGTVGTGDKVVIYKGDAVFATYTVLIRGDINGNGKITSLDLLMGQKHVLNISTLDGAYRSAADLNKDGKVSSLDLLMGQKHILGITPFRQ